MAITFRFIHIKGNTGRLQDPPPVFLYNTFFSAPGRNSDQFSQTAPRTWFSFHYNLESICVSLTRGNAVFCDLAQLYRHLGKPKTIVPDEQGVTIYFGEEEKAATQPANPWHDAKKEMPEPGTSCLVAFKSVRGELLFEVAETRGDNFFIGGNNYYPNESDPEYEVCKTCGHVVQSEKRTPRYEVFIWTELPELPKEGEERG